MEVKLLQAVNRGELLITGDRDRDIRQCLYGETKDPIARRRGSSRVIRKLSLLRAHGLVKEIPGTRRDLLTENGAQAIAAIFLARQATVSQLAAA